MKQQETRRNMAQTEHRKQEQDTTYNANKTKLTTTHEHKQKTTY